MSRHSKMQADVEAIMRACVMDPDCPFKDFEFKDLCFSFNFYEDGTLLKYFAFNLSEDYPDHTVLTTCGQPGSHLPCETKALHKRLPVIFRDLTTAMYKKMVIGLPGQRSSDLVDNGSSDDLSDDDDEYDLGEASDEGEGKSTKMNPQLTRDIECVRRMYGADSVKYRAFPSIDDVDVSLSMDMKMFDAETAAAWRVNKDEPIILRLHLSLSQYLDGPVPRFEVFQSSQKDKFGVGSQLCKILELFMMSNWTLASQGEPHVLLDTEDFSGADSCMSSAVSDDSLAHVVSMGFPLDLARNALAMTGENIEEAVNLLISDPDSLGQSPSLRLEDRAPTLPTHPPRGTPYLKLLHATKPGQHLASRKTQAAKQASGGKRASSKSSPEKTWSQSLTHKMSSMLTRHGAETPIMHGERAKEVPSLEYGFLVQVMKYATQRLLTLNEFCVVCDQPHIFQNGAMLKPAVCARDLCVFSFQTLGVMSDAAEDIATQPEVVDVLVTMAIAACNSQRRELIFDPYPTVVDPQNPSDLAFEPKNKDYDKVLTALEGCNKQLQKTNLVGSNLKQMLDRHNILTYPLLQWIITSNRSHIVKLPQDKLLAFMHTRHQYLLLSSPPAKEAIFRNKKKKYGSTFAFHGSPLENWHSILRHGLMNASDTKYQVNGRVHGSGIYISPLAGHSFGYSRMDGARDQRGPVVSQADKSEERFIQSSNPKCLALCEVIKSDCLKKCNGNIWLTTDPDHVCTRFFFVYESGQVGDSEVNTQLKDHEEQILRAINYQFR